CCTSRRTLGSAPGAPRPSTSLSVAAGGQQESGSPATSASTSKLVSSRGLSWRPIISLHDPLSIPSNRVFPQPAKARSDQSTGQSCVCSSAGFIEIVVDDVIY